MTAYYVDGPVGSDGAAGTIGAPFATLGKATSVVIAGDTINIQGGTIYAEMLTVPVDSLTIAAYGTGKWRINGSKTRNYCIFSQGKSGLTISDGDMWGSLINGLFVGNDTAATTKSTFVFNRLWAHDIGPALTSPVTELDLGVGTCFMIRTGTTTGTAVIDGVTFNDCKAWNAGKLGFDCRWRVTNVAYNRCESFDNGTTAGASGGHGFSLHPFLAEIISGWSVESGTIYSQARVSTSDVEQRMANITIGSATYLVKNTSTPTTPGIGEWGVDATKLYVNINANPNTGSRTLALKRHPHGPFTYTLCKAHGNLTPGGNAEGHGFSADDLSGPCTYSQCESYSNFGDGFIVNDGENCTFKACQSYLNVQNGWETPRSYATTLYHCVAANNQQRGFYDAGSDSLNWTIKNCIAYNNGTAATRNGIGLTAGTAATLTQSNNYAYANSAAGQVDPPGIATLADPLFVSSTRNNFQLQSTSPCLVSGAAGLATVDFAGMNFAAVPSIGAFERKLGFMRL